MAKDKISEYSATNSANTVVGDIDIDEGCLPSGINNAIREVMTHLKDFSDGTSGVDVLNLQDDDASASIKIQAPAAVTTTTTFTLPDGDGTSGQVLQTNGTGTLSWTSNGLANVVEDTTPQLGGNLDLNSQNITGTGGINITGTVTATDAVLNGTGAIKVPVGTTAQRPTPAQGQIRYNTTDSSFEGYDGSAWGAIGGGSENSFTVFEYTATASQTTFSGADDNAATLAYTAGNIQVMLNGVVLDPSDYTATNGTSVVLASGAALNDVLNIYAFTSFSVADTVSASTGGTFSANVAVTGDLTVDTNTLYVDSTNNRVGIGTTGPSSLLHLYQGSGGDGLRFERDSYDTMDVELSENGLRIRNETDGRTDILIDGSGNLLVGKAALGSNVVGGEIRADGRVLAAVSSNYAGYFNRKTSDGNNVEFAKDGTTVGSIGTTSGDFYITKSGTNQTGIYFNELGMLPMTSGSISDDSRDIGQASYRWDDIYATNGTIQTSDQNEKQQIASLTDAEITAAKAISQLFKTFKWNSAVIEKGDAARTHTGVIAQDVEAAMTAAGLDAGDYAFFISSTWWEHSVDVPAVEAADAVLDDDGNVVTEAVEAQEAYTRTDTYYTAEEAPEGATEYNRKGIRYPELLSFVGAATEQRLANIETRLAALENA